MYNAFAKKLEGVRQLRPDEMAVLKSLTSRPRQYAAKKHLILEGDSPGPVFVVLEGWACRYKILPNGHRQIIAFLIPGDACDLHVGMLDQMDHGIQTITPAKVATISTLDMRTTMTNYPTIAEAMYLSQLIDEGILRAWIVSMGRRSSIERVAHLICELYIRMRNIDTDIRKRFSLPLSQIILADALGMTPVHINRVVRELRIAGAMTLGKGSIEIIDHGKLSQIAGFDENYLHRRLRQPSQADMAELAIRQAPRAS